MTNSLAPKPRPTRAPRALDLKIEHRPPGELRAEDRLTRSLADFAKIVETMDKAGASFVSVTQAFNTTTSMGRLTSTSSSRLPSSSAR